MITKASHGEKKSKKPKRSKADDDNTGHHSDKGVEVDSDHGRDAKIGEFLEGRTRLDDKGIETIQKRIAKTFAGGMVPLKNVLVTAQEESIQNGWPVHETGPWLQWLLTTNRQGVESSGEDSDREPWAKALKDIALFRQKMI